jgi:hypothetical protein
MKSGRRKRRGRLEEERKIDHELTLISANLSMKKCMDSLDRLERENTMLRQHFLVRIFSGNRKQIKNAFETWR